MSFSASSLNHSPMASGHSLTPSSPVQNASIHHADARPCSLSDASANSSGTVQHYRLRSLSASSLSSLTSLWAPPFRRRDESTNSASRSPSSHNLTLRRFTTTTSDRRSASGSYSRRTSFASILSARFQSEQVSPEKHLDSRLLLDVVEQDDDLSKDDGPIRQDSLIAQESSMDNVNGSDAARLSDSQIRDHESSPAEHSPRSNGVRRWLSTLRRRKQQSHPKSSPRSPRWTGHAFDNQVITTPKQQGTRHKNTDSQGSSLAFVSAVKSATATLASVSVATVSRRTTRWYRGHQRSSLLSGSDPRPSFDSQRSIMDEAAKQRSRKRREKIAELIRTEESYVADLKALSNAYFTLIGHHPTSASFARSSAQENISSILHLHSDLLASLHRLVPFAEYDQHQRPGAKTAATSSTLPASRSHTRWHSLDTVPLRMDHPVRSKLASIRQARRSLNISRSSDDEQRMLRCAPRVVADVARVVGEYMSRFSLYETYGANFELVARDIDEIQRTTAGWPDFDKAIEALSAHVGPVQSREANRRKAMTVKDLLIKPIQRLPRYELLFSDLCKLTPVCDDPDSNATIQDLLVQINATCQRMNEAKDDPIRSRMLESTWLLGDRLTFSNQVPRTVFLQLLGQVHLCACLYMAYRSKDRIKGSYVICILFGSTLLLATAAADDSSKYHTLAGIPLANATVVETDNGKGLQCHTAPHSWKLVFEHAARMYEIIMTACSAVEAEIWRSQIGARIEIQSRDVAEGVSNVFELHSPLISEMRSVGKAFGKPGSFVRRMSVHRTATVGPTTDLNQVIIKNTQAVKEALDNNSSNTSLQIPRSQSVATPSHVQTLAPRRAERVRLESLLSDVWTKDVLPYPGMQPRLSDPIRASANHVIRKFSMASITSNFSSSKRSGSYTSIANSRYEESVASLSKNKMGSGRGRAYTNSNVNVNSNGSGSGSKPRRAPLVDFHNAPEAFLPADFELQDPAAKRKKSALRTLTMTMERPFSPLFGGGGSGASSSLGGGGGAGVKQSTLRRTQSVKAVVPQKEVTTAADVTTDWPRKEDQPPSPALAGAAAPPLAPIYSIVQERTKTPARLQTSAAAQQRSEELVTPDPATVEKTPRKSRSKILRLFR